MILKIYRKLFFLLTKIVINTIYIYLFKMPKI